MEVYFNSIEKNGCRGAFPKGFLSWVRQQGYWGKERVYLCAGKVKDDEAIKVDIRPEVNPTLCQDARHTSLQNSSADWVMIDPPYSRNLARELYGTEKYFSGLKEFIIEAARICRPKGFILTLSYESPMEFIYCDLIKLHKIQTPYYCGKERYFAILERR